MKSIKQILIILIFLINSTCSPWDPEEYAQTNNAQREYALRVLPKLHLKGNEQVLDVGCGDGGLTGVIAHAFLSKGGHIKGIDKDEKMVALAKKIAISVQQYLYNKSSSKPSFLEKLNNPSAISIAPPNVDIERGDIVNYNSQKKYDAVVSFACLHWVSEYSKALKNITNALKPGGKTLLCHVVDDPPMEKEVRKVLATPKWKQYQAKYQNTPKIPDVPSAEKVLKGVRATGAIIEKFKVAAESIDGQDPEKVKKNFLSSPLYSYIPKKERKEFVEDVFTEYISQHPLDSNGKMSLCCTAVNIILKKK